MLPVYCSSIFQSWKWHTDCVTIPTIRCVFMVVNKTKRIFYGLASCWSEFDFRVGSVKYVSELGWLFSSLFGAPFRQLPAQECQAILQTATSAKGARDEPVPQWSAVLGASRGGHDGRQGKEDGHLQAHYQPQASAQEQEQSQRHSERTAHVNCPLWCIREGLHRD